MKKKVVIISATVILFLLVIMGVMIKGGNGQVVAQMNFTKEISVVDYVAKSEEASYEIVIEKSGNYIFYGKWEADVPGLITGCRIYDESGAVVFSSTAESCTMNSVPLPMKKGSYTMTLSYIASMEQWVEFVGEGFNPDEEYPFASDGQFTIPYEFKFEKQNFSFGIVMVLAMILGLALVVLMLTVIKTGGDVKSKYDERQELIRGRGFKYGFFTILFTNLLYYMLFLIGIAIPLGADLALVVNSLIGICVCACYCVWNDGYFALNERVGSFIAIAVIGGVINIIMGISAFVRGVAMYDGKFTFLSLNLFCGIMVIIICSVMLLKKYYKDRKDD